MAESELGRFTRENAMALHVTFSKLWPVEDARCYSGFLNAINVAVSLTEEESAGVSDAL